ncbi:hypothetical protein A4X09_0g6241 [Tilletia walkeri]|uniref:Rho-GAP domain-containing protein n=1 Tax=Tilletia walkeri TaxID=117179 RepID=A0A8X7N359_9BASI|nr:hypothetical protein A4X09_0g6241 [Tilletia walkeri]
MSTPSQLSIALPPTFQTSFWSAPQYRRGAQHLYSRLQTGIDENHNVIQVIQHRADSEFAHADNLATQANRTPYPAPPLFKDALSYHTRNQHLQHTADEDEEEEEDDNELRYDPAAQHDPTHKQQRPRGESALNISQAIRAIEAESLLTQANAHAKVANNLQRLVLQPFRKWSSEHRDRVTSSWNHVDASIQRFERQHVETEKLRATYENKCRIADEAEDDARFAPSFTPTPDLGTSTFSAAPTIVEPQPRVADSSSPAGGDSAPRTDKNGRPLPLDKDRIQRRETLRQQFGFRAKSPSLHPDDDDVGHPANSTRAETGAGEFAGVIVPTATPDASSTKSVSSGGRRSLGSQRPSAADQSSDMDDVPLGQLTPGSSSLKRSATLSSYLSSAVGRISGESASSIAASVKGLVGGLAEPRHIRARRDAESAERAYADAVISLDRTRCVVEEILLEHFVLLQRFETDRLKAVKAVLMSYHASFTQLVPTLAASIERIGLIQDTIVPEADLQRLIMEGRTGPYKPVAQVFHPYYHDDRAVLAGEGSGGFGMNLDAYTRAEALAREDSSGTEIAPGAPVKSSHSRTPSLAGPNKGMPAVPLVLGSLLSALERAYADPKRWPKPKSSEGGEGSAESSALLLASAEKRKSWIYEVPLSAVHRLRDILVEPHLLRAIAGLSPDDASFENSVGGGAAEGASPRPAISPSNLDLDRYDPPVLASTLKVWALELEQSLVPSDLWDSAAAIYEAAAGQEREARAKKQTPAPAAAAPAAAEEKEGEGEGNDAKTPTAESASVSAAAAAAADKGKGRSSNVGPNGAVVPEPLDAEVQAKIRADVIQDLTALLSKVPKIHLACLDAVIGHLHRMVKDTTTNEPEIVYLNKLGLSLGRAILRPKKEIAATLNAKHPTLLTMDLIQNYEAIFPALLARKARESELSAAHRRMPVRKRTKPIDQRLSRSQMLAAQAAQHQNGMPAMPPSGAGAGAGAAAANAASNVVTGARRLGQRIVTNVENAIATSSSPLSASPGDVSRTKELKEDDDEEGVPPTPIGARVLQGARADTATTSPAGASTPTAATPTAAASTGSSSSSAPLSNVQRLSRQFAAGGAGAAPVSPVVGSASAASGVRGPRPAGARSARPSGGAAVPAPAAEATKRVVDRESKDLAPSTQLGEELKRSRRRSWSRTVDSSDALAAATGDDEEEEEQ